MPWLSGYLREWRIAPSLCWGTSLTQYRKRGLPARHPWCCYSAMAHRVAYVFVDTRHKCRIACLAPVLALSRQSAYGSVAINVLHYLDSKIGTSLFVEIRGHYLNLLSPCLFLKPYIKAEMMHFASSLSVWSVVPQLPEVVGAVQALFSFVFIPSTLSPRKGPLVFLWRPTYDQSTSEWVSRPGEPFRPEVLKTVAGINCVSDNSTE